MGVACCAEPDQDSMGDEERDLPVPSTFLVTDRYTKFELSLPFCRTDINRFIKHVTDAEKISGGNGFVTADSLRAVFLTPAWNPLRQMGSLLSKMLVTAHFKNESKGQSAFEIDAEYLKLFGLLHC